MRVLSQLEPRNVFSFFEDICNIPHPSYKEEKISQYLVDFAKERNLEYYQDDLYNVVMIKEATPGYEEVEPIIIQGHMDMVCEKMPDCSKNMDEEGLDLAIDGDFVYAKGTTLGGDDGIALAYALAILDDDSLEHPRLEVVCTVSEEVGMEGATGLDVSMLKGKKLLNIDSEEEGIMLASCAGGCSTKVVLPIDYKEQTGAKLKVSVASLTGGHSGVEIDKGRGNANCIMARVLRDLNKESAISLLALEGGKKDNAIPRDCVAEILVAEASADVLVSKMQEIAENIKKEFDTSDPEMRISIEKEDVVTTSAVTVEDTAKLICLIQALPNGIMRMSQDIEGLVETSLNLGVLMLENNQAILRYAVRSSVDSAKMNVVDQIMVIAEGLGGTVETMGFYPAWEYKKDSVLREDMVRVYEDMFGRAPVVEAIHAGLECGILAGKISDLDAVSMGPNMYNIHTTEEKLSISSAKRMYRYIVELLRCK